MQNIRIGKDWILVEYYWWILSNFAFLIDTSLQRWLQLGVVPLIYNYTAINNWKFVKITFLFASQIDKDLDFLELSNNYQNKKISAKKIFKTNENLKRKICQWAVKRIVGWHKSFNKTKYRLGCSKNGERGVVARILYWWVKHYNWPRNGLAIVNLRHFSPLPTKKKALSPSNPSAWYYRRKFSNKNKSKMFWTNWVQKETGWKG